VRLGRCIAVEVALGVGFVAVVGAAGILSARELHAAWDAQPTWQVRATGTSVSWMRDAHLEPRARPITLFDGVSDERLLAPLRDSALARVRVNRGGSSISLRLELANGAMAAFKPEQINLQTIPRKEVAAFRLNRLLGLSAVPPAIGRKFALTELLARLTPSSLPSAARLQAEVIAHDGWVAGELSWWIPVIDHATVDGLLIDSSDGIARWTQYLTAGEPVPYAESLMIAQISDMLVFDYIINNPDRWSGSNSRCSPDQRVLYFMDNTMSFAPNPGEKAFSSLQKAQKFSRSLVESLRNLSEASVRAALAEDTGPWPELLTDDEIPSILYRRDRALAYIDQLTALHGPEKVLVFP
jgi:hypothetical protein